MFHKKSLRFKISFVILLIIIIMTGAGILAGNHFLDRYYINGKENSIVSVYENINSIYEAGLVFEEDDDTDADDDKENLLAAGEISDDLALKLDKISTKFNIDFIISVTLDPANLSQELSDKVLVAL